MARHSCQDVWFLWQDMATIIAGIPRKNPSRFSLTCGTFRGRSIIISAIQVADQRNGPNAPPNSFQSLSFDFLPISAFDYHLHMSLYIKTLIFLFLSCEFLAAAISSSRMNEHQVGGWWPCHLHWYEDYFEDHLCDGYSRLSFHIVHTPFSALRWCGCWLRSYHFEAKWLVCTVRVLGVRHLKESIYCAKANVGLAMRRILSHRLASKYSSANWLISDCAMHIELWEILHWTRALRSCGRRGPQLISVVLCTQSFRIQFCPTVGSRQDLDWCTSNVLCTATRGWIRVIWLV